MTSEALSMCIRICAYVSYTFVKISVVLLMCLQVSKSNAQTEGQCRWSGKAPGCGNGICPGTDDWYAIGNSAVDEDGNECADGINNLYCCPKVRKPRPFKVRVCTGTNLQGDCVVIEKWDTECVPLPDNVKHKANSVDTFGGCVRLYYEYDSSTYSVALHRGNSEKHENLANFNFANRTESVGPCLRNDFCTPKTACRLPVEELWDCCQGTVESTDESGGVVSNYRLGYQDRTAYIYAVIDSEHLDTGTRPTSESLQHVRSLGLDTDGVGMLVPARLGGKGTDPRNLFPLTSDPNIQTAFKTYEDIIYDLVTKHGKVSLDVYVHYLTPTDTRPTQVILSVTVHHANGSSLFFLDSVGNPVFPISGNRSLPVFVPRSPVTTKLPDDSGSTSTRSESITSSSIETTSSEYNNNNKTLQNPENSPPVPDNLLYYLIPPVLIFSLLVAVVFFFTAKLRKARASWRSMNTNLPLQVQPVVAQLPPLDPKLIIHSDWLALDKSCKLGEGEFGAVYKGTLKLCRQIAPERLSLSDSDSLQPQLNSANNSDSGSDPDPVTVAVKVLKESVSPAHRDAMVSEMNVLASVGLHSNVVRFYGAVAENYVNGQLTILMEFCEKGSLLGLLRENGEKVRRALGNADDMNYVIEGAYVHRDLVDFSLQLAGGMEYLELKKIIHGDLATRNLLVNDAGVLKISDFGLSKQLVNYDIYIKTSQCPLPFRWMSPEALKRRCFSIKSDVWSFGVTLWEIFTYGDIPFPGLTWTYDFADLLGNGTIILTRPEFACSQMKWIIDLCMNVCADRRPSFADLRQKIQGVQGILN